MCSYANRETVAKALGIYNAGNEQQTEVKYICVKFVVVFCRPDQCSLYE
jgi:hypothetical protein